MTKYEAIEKAKEEYNWNFLKDHPEWNNVKEVVLTSIQQYGYALQHASDRLRNDKEIILAAVQLNGLVLRYASDELKNDKEVALAAIQKNGMALEYTSDELRKNKNIVLTAIREDIRACMHSLLEGYQNFDKIIEKEGEVFLFSCWSNHEPEVRFKVANHHSFLPTEEQIVIGLKDWHDEIRGVYELRKDEWFAKIEENKLRKII